MMPIDPMSLPFCVLFQSNTVWWMPRGWDRLVRGVRTEAVVERGGGRTVEREEGECELDAGEEAEEEEMQPAEGLEELEPLLDRSAAG